MRTTRTITGTTLAALALAGGLALTQASASAHDGHEQEPVAASLTSGQRNVIRKATERFADVDVALAAGYLPSPECAARPDLGGMGFHYVNPQLMDDRINPRQPEILLYAEVDGERELVGVEYFTVDADQDLATDDDRPSVMGHAFDGPMEGHEPGMPVHYDLHAWVFADNPAGDLAAWNPTITCPAP